MTPEEIRAIARGRNEDHRLARDSGLKNQDISDDIRSEYERDVDRIQYTYYFRRLAETTQVASYSASYDPTVLDEPLLHNRMTHSVKVAQVGRRIAQYLLNDPKNHEGIKAAGGLSEDVVQAAGLVHDLGHPPYGHVGEHELDEFAREHELNDGFEGNAQTFRILTHLTAHLPTEEIKNVIGLDLTYGTLAAGVKYPWPRDLNGGKRWRKFGYYSSDGETFKRCIAPLLPGGPAHKTLEAAIMDWADDITYAVHDLEDFSAAQLIPLSALRHECKNPNETREKRHYEPTSSAEMNAFWAYATERMRGTDRVPSDDAKQIFGSFATSFPLISKGVEDFASADLMRLTSEIITAASKATMVLPSGRLDIEDGMNAAIEAFKQLTWYYVITRPKMVRKQYGQKRKLRFILNALLSQAEEAFQIEVFDPWDKIHAHPKRLSANEMSARARMLDPRLRSIVDGALKVARMKTQDGPERRAIICRGVVDFVASLRERDVEALYGDYGGGG